MVPAPWSPNLCSSEKTSGIPNGSYRAPKQRRDLFLVITIWQGTGANGEKIEVKVRDKRKGSAERLALLYEGSAQKGQMSMQGFPSESEATKWFINTIAVPYSKGRIDRTHVEVLKRMKLRDQSAEKRNRPRSPTRSRKRQTRPSLQLQFENALQEPG